LHDDIFEAINILITGEKSLAPRVILKNEIFLLPKGED